MFSFKLNPIFPIYKKRLEKTGSVTPAPSKERYDGTDLGISRSSGIFQVSDASVLSADCH